MTQPNHIPGTAHSPDGSGDTASMLTWGVRIASIALAMYVAAELSGILVVPPSNASPVWPGAGIALAVTLLFGSRALLGVFLGVAVLEFQLFDVAAVGSLPLALGLATGATLQAFVGSILIRHTVGPMPSLVRDSDILRFQLLGGPVACLTSASVGMLVLWSNDVIAPANLSSSWLTWWVGDTVGVVIFAPLVMILLGHRDPLWRGRKLTVALPTLLLLGAAFAFFWYANSEEEEEKHLKFEEQLRLYHESIELVFRRYLEVLNSLRSYFDSSDQVTPGEFRLFTREVLGKYAAVQALEWIPRVRQEDRTAFERELPGGEVIKWLDPDGLPQVAGVNDEYFAIQFIEPSEGNSAAYGFDVSSNPVAAKALSLTIDSGQVAATAALKLMQEAGDDVGIVFYSPVYGKLQSPTDIAQRREMIRGVVAAVFRIRALIAAEVPVIGKGDIVVRLLDISEGDDDALTLYESHPDFVHKPGGDGFFGNRDLLLAGRHWRLEYTATPEFIAAHTTWGVWVVLAGGLLVTALMSTGLLMLSGRSLRMEGQVAERTAELRAEVRQRREAESAVRQREDLLRNILDNLDAYIYMKDRQGCYLFANRAVRDLWQAEMKDIIGQSDDRFFDAETAKRVRSNDSRVLTAGETLRDEEFGTLPNGESAVYQSTKLPLRREDGEIYALCGISVDITEQKRHQKQLEFIAHYDALTNLPNRVLLSDRLQLAMAQATRNQHTLAVVYLDLDGFKPINDKYGHQVGDDLLKALSRRMKKTLREGDTVARLGGDEFVAVLIDFPRSPEGDALLLRLLEAVAEPVKIDGLILRISASLGVTLFPQSDEQDADQLLRQADQAMYIAKLAGKNRFHYFDSELDRNTRGRHKSLDRIAQGLAENEFVLYYQPKVNLETGKVIGVEALIRWQHPDQGLLLPADFLPVIEGHLLDVQVGRWVIDTALAQLSDWQQSGLDLPVSVNISSIQLEQPDFVDRLRERLSMYPDINRGSLVLEILETSALQDITEVSAIMLACREFGVEFALDDFGTGYSSLTYLKRLPVSHLKIDRSFVRDMLEDPDDLSILEGVIGLAGAFDIPTIAEGVESEQHGVRLLQLGCALAQGYVIARPMPAAQIPGWIDSWEPPVSWTRWVAVGGRTGG